LNIAKNIKQIAKDVLINEARAIENLIHFIDNDFEDCVREILKSKGRVVITGIGKNVSRIVYGKFLNPKDEW